MTRGIGRHVFIALIVMSSLCSAVAQEVVCFVYHRFGDDRYPSTNITIDDFRRQLEFFRTEGITVITLSEALARLRAGGVVGPTVVITVDDGYDSFLTGALPLLVEYGVPATLFVNSGSIGGHEMLSWQDLRDLQGQGIEIGNHSGSHAFFVDLPNDSRHEVFREDVESAQRRFLAQLGQEPGLFSYPFGEYDAGMKAVVEELGFAAAVTQTSGVVSGSSDLYLLPRFPMGGPYAKGKGFEAKAHMLSLPVVSVDPLSPVVEDSQAPSLAVRVRSAGLRLADAQCFVAGQPSCSLSVDASADPAVITMWGIDSLRARRTLYTVTIPADRGGAWHWFSQVWIRTRHQP